jgi:predicted TIM-barrel fold metal-dependent hydrolase
LEDFDAFVHSVRSAARVFLPSDDADPETLRASGRRNALATGGWDVRARLADMDQDGVAAEVIFHGLNAGRVDPLPFTTLGAGHGGSDQERQLVALGRHMYNEWLADFVSEQPERHAGLVQLPMWDVEASVHELEWAREHGLRGVNFPRPQPGLLPYNHPAYEPFWCAARSLEMPLTTHAQTGGDFNFSREGTGNATLAILDVVGENSRKAFAQLVFGGVFERHPGLSLVFTEQLGLWWTRLLSELDGVFAHTYGEDTKLPRKPSEYAAEHLYMGASCMAPFEAEDAVANGYVPNMLWGTDYPHPEGTWQYSRGDGEPQMTHLAIRDTFATIPLPETAMMLGQNAARLYGFDLHALEKVAEGIQAPTYGDLRTPYYDEPEDQRTRGATFAFRRHSAWD